MSSTPDVQLGIDITDDNILERANKIVKQRGEDYGHPLDDFRRIAQMWSALLGKDIGPDDVAKCMICVKLSRLVETPDHQDSRDDIAGYAWCLDEIITAMQAREREA